MQKVLINIKKISTSVHRCKPHLFQMPLCVAFVWERQELRHTQRHCTQKGGFLVWLFQCEFRPHKYVGIPVFYISVHGGGAKRDRKHYPFPSHFNNNSPAWNFAANLGGREASRRHSGGCRAWLLCRYRSRQVAGDCWKQLMKHKLPGWHQWKASTSLSG